MSSPEPEPDRKASRRYWIERLSTSAGERARLRADASADAAVSGRRIDVEMAADLRDLVRDASAGNDFLALVAWCAAVSLVLYRDTGCRRVVFATPSATRPTGVPNTLIHVVTVQSHKSFRDLLAILQRDMLVAERHPAYPFPVLLADLGLPVESHDLFDLVLAHRGVSTPAEAAGRAVTLLFDSTGAVPEIAATLQAPWAGTSVRRLIIRALAALRAGLARPDDPISELDLLGSAERERVLVSWNPAPIVQPDACVDQLFERQALRTPHAIAVEDPSTGATLSYQELDRRSSTLADHLRRRGIASEAAVALYLWPSPDVLVALLAVWKVGAAYVPIDPASASERIGRVLADAEVRAVITTSALRSTFRDADPPVVDLNAVSEDDGPAPAPARRHPDELAYIIYTSGSSGRPKGVMVSHRSLSNYLRWAAGAYLAQGDRGVPVVSSIAFDLSITALLVPLIAGERVLIAPGLQRLDALSAALSRRPWFGLIKATPSHLLALGDALPPDVLAGTTRCLVVGGELLREAHLARWRSSADGIRVVNEYGPTETTVGSSYFESRAADPTGVVPIGRPVANTRLYLLDADLQPVPDGIPGEIYIGGAGVARGYRHDPAQTADRFVPDPFSREPGERLYRTSDIAVRRDDGELEFLGRGDRQVKLHGFRIEPAEIEAAMLAFPGIKASCLVARVESTHAARLVAYLVSDGPPPTWREIRQHLKARLPDYMMPAAFIALDCLPTTASGKVDLSKLPVPEAAAASSEGAEQATSTAAERTLLHIWREVLELPSLGVDDNILESGGDSILSLRVVGRARQAGLLIQPSDIFEHATVAALARVARPRTDHESADDTPAATLPLTPIQQWFWQRRAETLAVCCQTRDLQLSDTVDPSRLAAALALLVSRHDALRLRFHVDGDVPHQRVEPAEQAPLLESIDLSQTPDDARDVAVDAARRRCVSRLGVQGPLLQSVLFSFGSAEPVRLFIAVHHLAIDHVSWATLLDELECALTTTALPPAPTSFARCVSQMVRHADAGLFDEAARYWHRRVHLAPDETWLMPSSDGSTAADDIESPWVLTQLDSRETAALLHDVHRAYNTEVRDVLVAALARALARVSGAPTSQLALESNGRTPWSETLDVTRTVGWFTALFPIELRVDVAAPVGETLAHVKDELRRVPGDGSAFGIVRFLRGHHSALDGWRDSTVSLNYLGSIDREMRRAGLLRPIPAVREGTAQALHPVDVTALVADRVLWIEFVWQPHRAWRSVVERLAAAYVDELRAIIAECLEDRGPGYTPSDFPFVDVDQATLAAILDEADPGEGPPS